MFDDIASIPSKASKDKRPCALTVWLDTLSPEHRAQAVALIENKDYSARALNEYFESKGAVLGSPQGITRHRNRVCCKDRVA